MQRDKKLFAQAGQPIGSVVRSLPAPVSSRLPGGTFFTLHTPEARQLPQVVELARLRSECQGLHRAEPGVYFAAAAHELIFPPGAKGDAVALA
jgi:hypothetical protein